METLTDPPQKDSADLRLRRFTMGMGIVFFLFACGVVSFDQSGTLPGVGIPVTLEKPGYLKLLVYLSALYALGLFGYRNLYLKHPPWKIKGWLKKHGVLVLLSDPPGVLNAHASLSSIALQSHDKEEKEIFRIRIKDMVEGIDVTLLSDFCSSLSTEFQAKDKYEALAREAASNQFGKYFPGIKGEDLEVEEALFEDRRWITIKKPSLRTTESKLRTQFLGGWEDFIYALPLIPFGIGIFCFLFEVISDIFLIILDIYS